jgi:hypothetical protein
MESMIHSKLEVRMSSFRKQKVAALSGFAQFLQSSIDSVVKSFGGRYTLEFEGADISAQRMRLSKPNPRRMMRTKCMKG